MADIEEGYLKFNLDDTPMHLRPKTWTDTLNEFFYNYDFIIPADFRFGEIKGCNAGKLTIAGVKSDAMTVNRTHSHIANDPLDAYFVLLSGGGSISLQQRGREALVRNKAYSLVSTSNKYTYIQKDHTSFSNLIIPGSLMRQFAPNVDDLVSIATGTSMLEKIFFEFANSLCMECDKIDAAARDLMAKQATEMLGLILDGADENSSATPISMAHYRRVIQFIERNFSNPELDIDMLSAKLRISKRQLQHIAATKNTTISTMIKDRRIAEAKDLLSQRNVSGMSVSSICYMTGFDSHPHFCRTFKVATGQTPSRYEVSADAFVE